MSHFEKNNETELEQFLVDHVSFEYETAHTPTRADVRHRSRQKCTACEDHQPHFFVRSNGEYVGINSSTPQLERRHARKNQHRATHCWNFAQFVMLIRRDGTCRLYEFK